MRRTRTLKLDAIAERAIAQIHDRSRSTARKEVIHVVLPIHALHADTSAHHSYAHPGRSPTAVAMTGSTAQPRNCTDLPRRRPKSKSTEGGSNAKPRDSEPEQGRHRQGQVGE